MSLLEQTVAPRYMGYARLPGTAGDGTPFAGSLRAVSGFDEEGRSSILVSRTDDLAKRGLEPKESPCPPVASKVAVNCERAPIAKVNDLVWL